MFYSDYKFGYRLNTILQIVALSAFVFSCFGQSRNSLLGLTISGPTLLEPEQKGKWEIHIDSLPRKKKSTVTYFWNMEENGSYKPDSSVVSKSFKHTGSFWIKAKAEIDTSICFRPGSLLVYIAQPGIIVQNLPDTVHISVDDTIIFEPKIKTTHPVKRYKWYFLGNRIWQFASGKSGEASYKYNKEGNYNSIFFVSDVAGGYLRDTVQVIVTNLAPHVELPKDTTIRGSENLAFLYKIKDDGKTSHVKWDFEGDGQWDWESNSPAFPVHKYTSKQTGQKAITFHPVIRVEDNDGNTAKASFCVTVNFAVPKADAGKNTIVCLGDTIMYNGWQSLAFSGEIDKWEWDFNSDGKIDTVCDVGEVRKISPPVPGSYWTHLWVVDEFGNKSLSDSVKIIVMKDVPIAVIDSFVTVSVMDTVWFHGRGMKQCGSIVEYAWDLNGNGNWEWRNSNNSRLYYIFKKPGIYYSRFQVVGDDGQKGNAIRIVRVLNTNTK